MKIILINGKKQSGKTFFAGLLKDELEKQEKAVEVMAFADSIKDILCISLGIDLDTFNEYKVNRTPIVINGIKYNDVRLFIQKFGTEAMQNAFGKTVWTDVLLKKVECSVADYILVPDLRFKHEFIPGALTVQIINDDLKSTDNHASEVELDGYEYEYVIDNTGKPDMTPKVQNYIKNILKL